MLEIAKERQEWAKLYGNRIFAIKMVPPFNKNEPIEYTIRRDPYQNIVQKAVFGNLSMGYAIISGMRNINKSIPLGEKMRKVTQKVPSRGLQGSLWKRQNSTSIRSG